MRDDGETKREQQLRDLVHDVKQCLHVIGMGLEILKKARNDDRRFKETCELIENERKEAGGLLDQFLNASHSPEE